ncbi:acetolactate synthase 3, chloroplastic [Selaginella moellendorffii]|uniref:acetolactate synthase 3, chloroplastic n=1 Tax=Selaginella moellendorffii TaxID=88036 RepID=UPI000D1CBAFB|nr:acetolactate synthase 3, chloroplastic [Selaginella moellendorffii]|eukprot:XP_024516466.1 acetolactate synthase 3, chloroplastic [Selaginella moellendorffii]
MAATGIAGGAIAMQVCRRSTGLNSRSEENLSLAELISPIRRGISSSRGRIRAGIEPFEEPRVIVKESQGSSTIFRKQSEASPPASLFQSRYGDSEPRKGADILVEALERQGVDIVFAYPGGASMEIHQALTRSTCIRNVLCRHEQGEVFAAEGYAKASGKVGVCIATSGPGATNLVTGLADAALDSVPMVAITGQVPRRMIGTDAFQETPIVEVTRSITKHNYLVMNVEDIPRVIEEAFFLASSGRPGPVLVDIPKDVQQQFAIPNWSQPIKLNAYMQRLPRFPEVAQLQQIVRLIANSKRPVVYCGGGCMNSSEEVREFVKLTGIPITMTLMGLGIFPQSDSRSLHMLGMHGTVYANYAVDGADLLLAFGVRFDDRVTGKLEAFASRASIVHIDIDPAEIGKNKQPHVSLCADVKPALQSLNLLLREQKVKPDVGSWIAELEEQKLKWPLKYVEFGDDCIAPQHAIQTLCEITQGNAIISTGVGQHQMWAAQWFKYDKPRRWLTSGGLGAMGFGLPSAIGAAATFPDVPVIDIDGDGSFLMNVQELATIHVEKLPVKIMVLNNQHLGMVVQWEDRFYKANRAHTYLGDPDHEDEIFPDFLKFAEGCKIPCARVTKRSNLKAAIQKMLDTPGPYLLDVIVPHQEHVLPMIPGGSSFKDIITEGDGRKTY